MSLEKKNKDKIITLRSPATVANLVCGFDILGLALNKPYDIMVRIPLDGALAVR